MGFLPEERHMEEALRLAARAAEAGEVPVGAVIVKDGRVLARAHNQVETLRDATAHAEMIAITQAAEALENWRLEGAELFVTLEPCPMCAGALVLSRVARIVYGADDPIAGACGSVFNIVDEKRLNHRIPVVKGVLADRCGDLLKDFFRRRRNSPKSPVQSPESDPPPPPGGEDAPRRHGGTEKPGSSGSRS